MRQTDSNRYEEYVTLREEIRELLSHGRFILYVTSAFIIGALAWYMGKTDISVVNPAAFSIFLYAVLVYSSLIYINSLSQAFRIGGYVAVFLESRDTERRLQWHRYNRKGAPGGYLTGAAQIAYAALTLVVAGWLAYLFFTMPIDMRGWILWSILGGLLITACFSQIRNYLRIDRDRFERECIHIRASPDRQDEIHDAYETIPLNDRLLIRR